MSSNSMIKWCFMPRIAPAVFLFFIVSLVGLAGCGDPFAGRVEKADVLAGAINSAMIGIREELGGIGESASAVLADVSAYSEGVFPEQDYEFHNDVVYYNPEDMGHGAFYYTGAKPVDGKRQQKVKALEHVIAEMTLLAELGTNAENVSQAYVITNDSLLVFYPYANLLPYIPPKRDMTTRGFWKHANRVVEMGMGEAWGTPHVDTTGKGYMVDIIVPILVGGELVAAAGADVTLKTLRKRFLAGSDEPLLLIDRRTSQVLAVTEAASNLLQVGNVEAFKYLDQIENVEDAPIVMPRNLVLDNTTSPVMRELWEGLKAGKDFSVNVAGESHRVHGVEISDPKWILVVLE